MNAPVNEQIKVEAAKSLLERLSEKTKLVQLFRRNAAMKHGVPLGDEEGINITSKEEPVAGRNIVQVIRSDNERSTSSTSPTISDKVKGALQTIAVLGGLGGAGWAGYALSNSGTDKNVKDTTNVSAPYYSPYQYLEDNGEHLP